MRASTARTETAPVLMGDWRSSRNPLDSVPLRLFAAPLAAGLCVAAFGGEFLLAHCTDERVNRRGCRFIWDNFRWPFEFPRTPRREPLALPVPSEFERNCAAAGERALRGLLERRRPRLWIRKGFAGRDFCVYHAAVLEDAVE